MGGALDLGPGLPPAARGSSQENSRRGSVGGLHGVLRLGHGLRAGPLVHPRDGVRAPQVHWKGGGQVRVNCWTLVRMAYVGLVVVGSCSVAANVHFSKSR